MEIPPEESRCSQQLLFVILVLLHFTCTICLVNFTKVYITEHVLYLVLAMHADIPKI